MGYLDEFEAANLVPASVLGQIRGAYSPLLEEFQRRERAGERFVLADLIAYQFLLEKFLGASTKCDAGVMPPLVRRLPFARLHQNDALIEIADVPVCEPDETLGASSQMTTSSTRACASDRSTFDVCAHCAGAPDCRQLGCVYEELLVSIAARLEAIRAA